MLLFFSWKIFFLKYFIYLSNFLAKTESIITADPTKASFEISSLVDKSARSHFVMSPAGFWQQLQYTYCPHNDSEWKICVNWHCTLECGILGERKKNAHSLVVCFFSTQMAVLKLIKQQSLFACYEPHVVHCCCHSQW